MLLQQILSQRKRLPAILDVLEALSGFGLALFLWMHMLFVSFIWFFGQQGYNDLAVTLDRLGLTYIFVPLTVALFFFHFILAARKIPTQWRDQRVIITHIGFLKHKDTFTWAIQVISGMAILILASIHLWVVMLGIVGPPVEPSEEIMWPQITSNISSIRAAKDFFVFYIVLLILGEVHASLGLYRLGVKWGIPSRKITEFLLLIVTITILTLGGIALYEFVRLAG